MAGDKQSMGYMDLVIFEKLFELLPNYISIPDCQMVFDDLRDLIPLENSVDLKTIHNASLNCTRCEGLGSNQVLPSWNTTDPDIVFVSSNAKLSEPGAELLIKCLKTAGFNSSRCALSYALRCPAKKYDIENISNCSNFLLSELSIWKPKLIVLMGKNALMSFSQVFKDEKLQDVSGDIYWLGPWAYMPIESPDSATFKTDLSHYLQYFIDAYEFCYGPS